MTVTLRFVTCGDLISHAIRGAEMGFFASHVEAAFPDGYLGAHADTGVALRPVAYDKGQRSAVLFVTIPATDVQSLAFEQFLRSQVGKPYDMDAINDMAIGELTGDDANYLSASLEQPSWICSALIYAALISAKIIPPNSEYVRLITPRDVYFVASALARTGKPLAA